MAKSRDEWSGSESWFILKTVGTGKVRREKWTGEPSSSAEGRKRDL